MRLSAAVVTMHDIEGWLIYPLGIVAIWLVLAGSYLVATRSVTFSRYFRFASTLLAIQTAFQVAIFTALWGVLHVFWLLVILASYLLLMGLAATRVGYQFRDAGLLLIPLVNVQLHIEWLWRLAHLPDRYWDRDGNLSLG